MHHADRAAGKIIEHDFGGVALVGAGQVMQLQLDVDLRARRLGLHVGVRGGTRHAHEAIAQQQPAQAHFHFLEAAGHDLVQRFDAAQFEHQARLQMVAQVFANAGQMLVDGDTQFAEACGVADAGEFKQLRGLNRTRTERHFARGARRHQLAVLHPLDAADAACSATARTSACSCTRRTA